MFTLLDDVEKFCHQLKTAHSEYCDLHFKLTSLIGEMNEFWSGNVADLFTQILESCAQNLNKVTDEINDLGQNLNHNRYVFEKVRKAYRSDEMKKAYEEYVASSGFDSISKLLEFDHQFYGNMLGLEFNIVNIPRGLNSHYYNGYTLYKK